jgi:hypothetical protein
MCYAPPLASIVRRVFVGGKLMKCALCPNQVDPEDQDVLQEELVWQGGQKDEYREHTGRVAHRDCVLQKSEGRDDQLVNFDDQVKGQQTLFDTDQEPI